MESPRMSPLPTAPAARLRRPGWRDPRLVVGVLLVACSVALGIWVVQAGRTTVGVYATTRAVVPGEVLAASDLTIVQATVPGSDAYLLETAPLPVDAVLVRAVGAGELVPVSALGQGGDVTVRPVAVPAGDALSSAVEVGGSVDLWFVPAAQPSTQSAAPPRLLAEALVVAEVSGASGGLGPGASRAVHVLVPTAALPDVLAALAADGTTSVVPVPGVGS